MSQSSSSIGSVGHSIPQTLTPEPAHRSLTLSQEAMDEIDRYWPETTSKLRQSVINQRKAEEYINTHLQIVDVKVTRPYNCFEVGYTIYTRAKGGPLTDDDIAAVKDLDHGQCNTFAVSEDRLSIKHYWECDSSD